MKVKPILKSITILETIFKDLSNIVLKNIDEGIVENKDIARTAETTSDTPTKPASEIVKDDQLNREKEADARTIAQSQAIPGEKPPSQASAERTAAATTSNTGTPSAATQGQRQFSGSRKPMTPEQKAEWKRKQIADHEARMKAEREAAIAERRRAEAQSAIQGQVIQDVSTLTPTSVRQTEQSTPIVSTPQNPQVVPPTLPVSEAKTAEEFSQAALQAPPTDEVDVQIQQALESGTQIDPKILKLYEARKFFEKFTGRQFGSAVSPAGIKFDTQAETAKFLEFFGEDAFKEIFPPSVLARIGETGDLKTLFRNYRPSQIDTYLKYKLIQERRALASGGQVPEWAKDPEAEDIQFREDFYRENRAAPKRDILAKPADPDIVPGKEPRKRDKKETPYRYLRDEQDPKSPGVYIGGDRKRRQIQTVSSNDPQAVSAAFLAEKLRRSTGAGSKVNIPVEIVQDDQGNPAIVTAKFLAGKKDKGLYKDGVPPAEYGTSGQFVPYMSAMLQDALVGNPATQQLTPNDFQYINDRSNGGARGVNIIQRKINDEAAAIPAFATGSVEDINIPRLMQQYMDFARANKISMDGSSPFQGAAAKAILKPYEEIAKQGWDVYVRSMDPKGEVLSDEQVQQYAQTLAQRYESIKKQLVEEEQRQLAAIQKEKTASADLRSFPKQAEAVTSQAISSAIFNPKTIQEPFSPESFYAALDPENNRQAETLLRARMIRREADGSISASPYVLASIQTQLKSIQQQFLEASGGQAITPEGVQQYLLEKQPELKSLEPEKLAEYAQNFYKKIEEMSAWSKEKESVYREETASSKGEQVVGSRASIPNLRAIHGTPATAALLERLDTQLEQSQKIPGYSAQSALETVTLWKQSYIHNSPALQAISAAVVQKILTGEDPSFEELKRLGALSANDGALEASDKRMAQGAETVYQGFLNLALRRQEVRADVLYHYGLDPQTNSWELVRGVSLPNIGVDPATKYSDMDGIVESWFDDGVEYISPQTHALSSWGFADPAKAGKQGKIKEGEPGYSESDLMGVFYTGERGTPQEDNDSILWHTVVPDSMVLTDFLGQSNFDPQEVEFVVMSHPDQPIRSDKTKVRIRIAGKEYTYEQREEAREALKVAKQLALEQPELEKATRDNIKRYTVRSPQNLRYEEYIPWE